MTTIEWTDVTWNPVTGCDRTSPGCDHCYALTLAKRLKAMGQPHYQTDGDARTSGPGFGVAVHPDALDLPLRWRRPRRVFVNSMSDLFHPDVPDDFILAVWRQMRATPQHTYQILTKRPQRMAAFTRDLWTDVDGWLRCRRPDGMPIAGALPNVWLGTSIESNRYVFRARHLAETISLTRFLSCEPLLGPLFDLKVHHFDWVIAGGESGPGARPTAPNWVQDLRDTCIGAGVAFFFKQWGSWVPYEIDAQPPFWNGQDGETVDGHILPADISEHRPTQGWYWPEWAVQMDYVWRRRPKGHRLLDGRTWDEYPA